MRVIIKLKNWVAITKKIIEKAEHITVIINLKNQVLFCLDLMIFFPRRCK